MNRSAGLCQQDYGPTVHRKCNCASGIKPADALAARYNQFFPPPPIPFVIAFADFHPVVRQWFTTEVGEPTSAQLRGWDSIAAGRGTLIAAPTCSGKTLAAFLTAINVLFEESLRTPLPDEVRIIYVSPLKALSADIDKNLAEPRAGIFHLAEQAGLQAPAITAMVRTGDGLPKCFVPGI